MVAFLIVFSGFPIFALPLTAMTVGLLLGLFLKNFVRAVIIEFQSTISWLIDLFPLSWVYSHTEDLGDGTQMEHLTWFGDVLAFIDELVSLLPTHGPGLVVAFVILYTVFEFMTLIFFIKLALRKNRSVVINEQEQRMF